MLYKKELSEYPKLPYSARTGKDNRKHYTATIKFEEFRRSGKVAIVDFYRAYDKKFMCRFVSDGKNYATAYEYPVRAWTERSPSKSLGNDVYSRKEDRTALNDFLNHDSYRYFNSDYSGVYEAIDHFIDEIRSNRRQKAFDSYMALQKKHFSMFPEYPADLREYCEKNVFPFGYVFLQKAGKKSNERKGHCSYCRKEISLPKGSRSGQMTECPNCGRKVFVKLRKKEEVISDTEKICIAGKVDNQLLIRWVDVCRETSADKLLSKYYFSDYAYNLYLKTNTGSRIYFYKYMKAPYAYDFSWFRKIGEYCFDETYVYTENLSEVFGEKYYNVNLRQGLERFHGKVEFSALLNSLKNRREAEYLFKLGMPKLAAKADAITWPEEKTDHPDFQSMLGVSNQYKELYRTENVTVSEHKMIKAIPETITAEDLNNFRKLKIEWGLNDRFEECSKQVGFRKLVRYLSKQMEAGKRVTAKSYLELYSDYLSMSKSLRVDMSNKSVLFPENIKAAHDLILPRFNEVKHKEEYAEFATAIAELYPKLNLQPFSKDGFCVVLPQSPSDFVREGQTLNHCVGTARYYKEHMKGTSMIFFVRKEENPDKPFFTMEIDMRTYKIRQLYGFGDCSAPKDVRQFAEDYARALPQFAKMAALLEAAS